MGYVEGLVTLGRGAYRIGACLIHVIIGCHPVIIILDEISGILRFEPECGKEQCRYC